MHKHAIPTAAFKFYMDSRKRVYLFLPFFIAFALFVGGISYADVDLPDAKKSAVSEQAVSEPAVAAGE